MPFQPGQSGNPTGARGDKLFRKALLMELKAVEKDDERGLRRIARNLMKQAEEGEMAAIREVADRIDGKPAQELVGGGAEEAPILIQRIERIIVDPSNTNS